VSDSPAAVPLHLLHAWWASEQREAGEKILADTGAQLANAEPEVREAVLGAVRRELYHRHDLELAQLDRVIADEIERRLRQ